MKKLFASITKSGSEKTEAAEPEPVEAPAKPEAWELVNEIRKTLHEAQDRLAAKREQHEADKAYSAKVEAAYGIVPWMVENAVLSGRNAIIDYEDHVASIEAHLERAEKVRDVLEEKVVQENLARMFYHDVRQAQMRAQGSLNSMKGRIW